MVGRGAQAAMGQHSTLVTSSWRALTNTGVWFARCCWLLLLLACHAVGPLLLRSGWFQSALLTATACVKTAPYKTIVTHGFTLDENLRKMSKSLGNVIAPQDVIDGSSNKQGKKMFPTPYGADVLRYWVASTDFASDQAVGPSIIATVSEGLRKVRNTARFLLGALHGLSTSELRDLSVVDGAVSWPHPDDMSRLWSMSPARLWSEGGLATLTPIDRYMLLKLAEYNREVTAAYEEFNYAKVNGCPGFC